MQMYTYIAPAGFLEFAFIVNQKHINQQDENYAADLLTSLQLTSEYMYV